MVLYCGVFCAGCGSGSALDWLRLRSGDLKFGILIISKIQKSIIASSMKFMGPDAFRTTKGGKRTDHW